MRHDTLAHWRRLLWASHGNAYLYGAMALRDWAGHPRLRDDAVSCFVSDDTPGIAAANAFEWLWWQRHRGARRLSVGVCDSLPAAAGHAAWDRQVLRCHFDDRTEVWATGGRVSAAAALARLRGDADAIVGWGAPASLEVVVRLTEPGRGVTPAGGDPPPRYDWQGLRRRFHAELRTHEAVDLDLTLPSRLDDWSACGFGAPDGRWASPLPPLPGSRGAHLLLAEARLLAWRFQASTNPKDEGNLYNRCTTRDDRRRVDAYADWLDRWLGALQGAAGSETRWARRAAFRAGLPTPAAPPGSVVVDPLQAQGATPRAEAPAPAVAGRPFGWAEFRGLLLIVAVAAGVVSVAWYWPRQFLVMLAVYGLFRLLVRR